MENLIPCPDCKALVPDIEGPVHAYIGGSAGCWKIYGEVLAKEFSDEAYFKVHRLTVDAYAAQHPGKTTAQSIQSVNGHLIALYLIFEKNYSFDRARKSLGAIIKQKKGQFVWLTPPKDPAAITVVDVVQARDEYEHEEKVRAWARSVWQSWSHCHSVIADLAREL